MIIALFVTRITERADLDAVRCAAFPTPITIANVMTGDHNEAVKWRPRQLERTLPNSRQADLRLDRQHIVGAGVDHGFQVAADVGVSWIVKAV